MQPPVATRKPIDRLTVEDLESFPVWNFTTDEEGVDRMDETWVKPLSRKAIPDNEYSVIVATVFRLNCGLIYPGFICCDTFANLDVASITLLTEGDRFIFSEGTPQKHVAEALREFGFEQDEIFPVKYSTRVPLRSTRSLVQGSYNLPTITASAGAA